MCNSSEVAYFMQWQWVQSIHAKTDYAKDANEECQ